MLQCLWMIGTHTAQGIATAIPHPSSFDVTCTDDNAEHSGDYVVYFVRFDGMATTWDCDYFNSNVNATTSTHMGLRLQLKCDCDYLHSHGIATTSTQM